MHPSTEPPGIVADLLDPILQYHRDRDEAPIFWRYAYVTGEGNPKQDSYDEAVRLWSQVIEHLEGAVQDELETEHGRWNSLVALPGGPLRTRSYAIPARCPKSDAYSSTLARLATSAFDWRLFAHRKKHAERDARKALERRERFICAEEWLHAVDASGGNDGGVDDEEL
jgi:hypothetical protein